jgi:hypothetical protein
MLLTRKNKTDQVASTLYAIHNKKFIYLSKLEKKNNQLYIDLDDEKNIEITEENIKLLLEKFNIFYKINNIDIFKRAFIHRSYVSENLSDYKLVKLPYRCIELKKYSHLNHYDKKRRDLYRSRHKNDKLNEYSPGWFSYYWLW